MSSNNIEAKWYVKVTGHPKPHFVWRDNRNIEIPWSQIEDKRRKLDAIHDDRSTTLKIRNPSISDSGYYTLIADNTQRKEEKKFQLLVKGNLYNRIIISQQILQEPFH